MIEEDLEISKLVSASISTLLYDKGKYIIFQNFNRWNISTEILAYSGKEEFAETIPVEPTIEPLKILQTGLTGNNKSFWQLASITRRSSSSKTVFHGQKRRPWKSSKTAVDDNRVLEDAFDSTFSGNQTEASKEDVNHEKESKSSTHSTGVIGSAAKKVKHESNDNDNPCMWKQVSTQMLQPLQTESTSLQDLKDARIILFFQW